MNRLLIAAAIIVIVTPAYAVVRPSDAEVVGIFDAWLEACKPNASPTYRAEVLDYNKLPGEGGEAYSRAHYRAKHNAAKTLEDQSTYACAMIRALLNSAYSLKF